MEALLNKIKQSPEQIGFDTVIDIIQQHYHYTPTTFSNGLGNETLVNTAGSNEGSCRIFAFAHLHQLSEAETLACFGDFYREDVLQNPDGDDHKNIRNFMKYGWQGIQFSGKALSEK
ncbi:HopJ type III effector protein [Photobacterium sp. OFAV2-7]|uniref:HopJ type III effector protein n=1 Tax=Photobacterium sp. OFAV2-7 TaxID=2917748 RepID=UPI001EF3EA73|nr:HopJ type III effector protein [Photobacterium sp. OFAV2-7]MCG7587780.1 HopJ type III effector protein [Photobacterium sp. OFAV2-7]